MKCSFFNTPFPVSHLIYHCNYILGCWLVLLVWCTPRLCAQTSVVFLNPASGPSTSGPTTADQVITFYTNASVPYAPTITATFSLSNQQFASVEGNPSVPGSTFGTTVSSTSNSNLPVSNPTYDLMNAISGPSNSNFTSCKACAVGTGVDVTQNRAVALFNSSDALIDATGASPYPLTARVQFADLTITFNRPVNNPILHVVGLGGFYFYSTTINGTLTAYDLGLTTELDLLTPGVTLSKVSGNTALNVTTNSIQNGAAQYGSATASAVLDGVTRTAATGSVSVNGFGLTSVMFRIYLKGDGGTIRNSSGSVVSGNNGNVVRWSSQLNFTPGGSTGALSAFSGDKYLLGMSLQPCQQVLITNPSGAQQVCQGTTGANVTVQTDINTANSIRFVKFTSDQMVGTTPTVAEAAAIYAGTPISTVTPTGSGPNYTATYAWNAADFPTTGTYYIYAILNPNPGGDCYPVQEIAVTIVPTIAITTQPTAVAECIGGTQSLSVSATGGVAPLTYQWQSSTTVGGTYADIAGATSTTYLLPSGSTSALFYRVVVASASGSTCNAATSNAVSGTVGNAPSVSVAVPPAIVCMGANVTLTATPTITIGTCGVQWQSSPNGTTWTNISGATNTTYNVANLTTNTRYRAQLVSCTGSGCCN